MLEDVPTKKELVSLIGQSKYDVWQKLCVLIDEKYHMDRLWNSGGKQWGMNYKYRKGGKTLCALYVKENNLGFQIIFGKAERAKFEENRKTYSKEVQNIYDEAKIYHDGKWIMFELVDTSMFQELIQLLGLKRKPNRK